MDDVFPPHGGVAIVMKAPGRKLWLVVAALVAVVVLLALIAARGNDTLLLALAKRLN